MSAEWPERRRGFTENDLLGRVHDELGDTDQALSSYRAALSQNPHATDVRRRMIAVLERAGQTAAVLREYQRLSSDAPGEPRYYLELAERLHVGCRPHVLVMVEQREAQPRRVLLQLLAHHTRALFAARSTAGGGESEVRRAVCRTTRFRRLRRSTKWPVKKMR